KLAIAAAAPLILVKPHYGLLCVLMLAHRFWRERRFSIALDFDFLALAVGVILYAGVVMLWFPDFLTEIMPFITQLYIKDIIKDVFLSAEGMGILSVCLLTLALCSDGDRDERRFAVFLCCMALAADIPFFVQLKGFYLHMLPVFVFLVPAVLMTASLYIKRIKIPQAALSAIVILGIAIFSYLFMTANPYATHDDYRDSSLAQYLEEHAKGSSFLMQSITTNVVVPVSVYTGIPHATRFPNLWFVGLLDVSQDGGKMASYLSRLVAEDLDRYKPAVVALYHDPAPRDDLVEKLGGRPEFDRAWSHYRKVDEFKLDFRQFYKRKLYKSLGYDRFDIYERQQ
ncbi:MAG TPA: hypothetical protein VIF12_08725, partial [Micavibrio sp.]